jgi:hypothetical protein
MHPKAECTHSSSRSVQPSRTCECRPHPLQHVARYTRRPHLLQQQIRTDPYGQPQSFSNTSFSNQSFSSATAEFQQHEFQQPQNFSSTLIEALWFRFETWFVVLVFLKAIISVRGALVSFDVIDEELILKSRNFVYCVIVFVNV